MNQRMASAAAMMVPSASVNEIVKRLSELALKEVDLLLGVKDELKKLKTKLKTISGVLEDAENREFQDASIRRWLIELRDIMYDIEDIIDDCSLHYINNSSPSYEHGSTSSASKKLEDIISKPVKNHVMGKRIEEINDRMERIHKDREQLKLVQTVQIQGSVPSHQAPAYKRPETTSWFIESEVVGIDEDAERLVRLMEEPNMAAGGRVYAIVGMGGIGKTTLAQKVYNKSNFEQKIWVCVSQDYKEHDVLKQIIRCAGGKYKKDQTKEELYSKMKELLDGKDVLVVLDDLWSDGVWKDCLRVPFQALTAESRVLITTRDEGIALQMKAVHTHPVQELSDDEGWSLLCKVVCQGNMDEIEGLEDVGMEIVRKCKGLPLAIKVIGGVLNRRRINAREWWTVLSDFLRLSGDGTSEIMSVLRLSYMDLPSYLKPCFLFCSLFPEDYQIPRHDVIQMWVAEGLVKEQEGDARQMEDLAELYYDELVMRSLLQVVTQHSLYTKCKMHDLVRDLAISMTRGEHIVGHDRQQGGSMTARRLSILRVEELEQIPERVKNQKYCSLRSLLVFLGQNMKVIPPALSDKLKHLRVLHLREASFKHLPDSIGEIVHLRYLNLSYSSIVKLPNSICNLRHLQTLLLWGSMISEIPKGISQLQKLRHLEVSYGVDIHGEIGKLTDLQTLQAFTVCNRDDGRCSIKELNCLSQLRYLAVHDLGKVPGPTEAREAAIENKTHLRSLKLEVTRLTPVEIQGEQDQIRRMKEILEAFCPNESLECLVITNFFAGMLPGWISMTPPLLRNLNSLELNGNNDLKQLPSFGHLPQLRILRVIFCLSMTTLGLEPHSDQGGNGGGAYPMLEELYLSFMHELEEWGGGGKRKDIFPRLKLLDLIHCPKLRSLPVGLLDPNTVGLLDPDMKLRAGIELYRDRMAVDGLWVVPI